MIEKVFKINCEWCGREEFLSAKKGRTNQLAKFKFISYGWIFYNSGLFEREERTFCSTGCKTLFKQDEK